MASALAWLNDIMQWIGRWFPRLTLVLPTHRMVLCGRAGRTRLCGPGLVLYWPIIQVPILVSIVTQSVELSARCLPRTQDNSLLPRVWFYVVAVQFRVLDPILAATRALNFHALVDNRTQSAITRAWGTEEGGTMTGIMELAKPEIASALLEYGIVLERCDLTSAGEAIAHKGLADWSYTDNPNGQRPA